MGERLVEYHHMDAAQSKLYQVFTYIRELTKLRRPPVGQSNTYEWSVRFSALPSYPTIQTSQIPDQAEEDFDGVILRVKRPTETPCPAPPDSLIGWLQNGWDKIENNAAHIPARNKKTATIKQLMNASKKNQKGLMTSAPGCHIGKPGKKSNTLFEKPLKCFLTSSNSRVSFNGNRKSTSFI